MKKTKRCGVVLVTATFFAGLLNLQAQTWSTTGNAGTSSSTNFVGTTDAVDFKIRTNGVERMSFGSGGFVGIGTSTAIGSSNFVISSSVNNWGGMYTNGNTSTTRPFYGYAVAGSAVAWQYYDPAKSALLFNVSGDRMTITNTGNVGIGTTTPTSALDVVGAGHFTAGLTATTGSFSSSVSGSSGSFTGTVSGNLGSFNSVSFGSFTLNSSGMANSNSIFTIHPEVVFEGDATFHSSWFHAKQIVGNTSSSAAGVEGNAIPNHPSLISYGVIGDANGSPFAYGVVCVGNGYYTGDWSELSDARFKTNVKTVNSGLDLIMQLQPKQYEFKRDEYQSMNFPAGEHYGFLAQDMEKVIPNLVSETSRPVDASKPDGEQMSFKMINYIGLIPVLTEAIQEQQTIINQQDSVIQSQNDRLAKLENQMSQLTSGSNDATKTSATIPANKLYPNQPNPFGQETVIKYNISNESTSAFIIIRDMQGTVQKTIALTQKGEGAITLQAQDLAAGVYTYELVVDGKTVDTKKMVVSK